MIVLSFTCSPNHDMGPTSDLRTNARPTRSHVHVSNRYTTLKVQMDIVKQEQGDRVQGSTYNYGRSDMIL